MTVGNWTTTLLLVCCLLLWKVQLTSSRDIGWMYGNDQEGQMIQTIFERMMHSEGRGIRDGNSSLQVSHTLRIVGFKVLRDEDRCEFRTVEQLSWVNKVLEWNDKFWGKVNGIRLKTSKIFTPDVVLLNAERSPQNLVMVSRAEVLPSGQIIWMPSRKYSVKCVVQKNYGATYTTANLRFGSWTMDTSMMNVFLPEGYTGADLSDVEGDRNWRIITAPVHSVPSQMAGKPYNYLQYKVNIKLQ